MVLVKFVGVALLTVWCAAASWIATWGIYPVAYQEWGLPTSLIATVWISDAIIAIVFLFDALVTRKLSPRPLLAAFLTHFGLSIFVAIALATSLGILSLLIAILIDVPILLYLSLSDDPSEDRPISIAAPLAGLGVPAAALLIWSIANIGLVGWKASEIADARPYCIQVPADGLGRYRPVTHWEQLAGLRMQTPFTNGGGSSDYQFAFHAVLLVQSDAKVELLNWSYRAQNFVPISETTQRMTSVQKSCNPRIRFLTDLFLRS